MRGDSNEKQLIVKKYKTFVNKIGGRTFDSGENNDLWRGANDFTRVSASKKKTEDDDILEQSQ